MSFALIIYVVLFAYTAYYVSPASLVDCRHSCASTYQSLARHPYSYMPRWIRMKVGSFFWAAVCTLEPYGFVANQRYNIDLLKSDLADPRRGPDGHLLRSAQSLQTLLPAP